VQKYQDEFVASRISSLKSTLETVIGSSTAKDIRTRTVLSHVLNALSAFDTQVQTEEKQLNSLAEKVSILRAQVSSVSTEAHSQILREEISEATQKARKEMKAVLDKLTWWKALWKAEEVGSVVALAVQQTWCRDLQEKVSPFLPFVARLLIPLTSLPRVDYLQDWYTIYPPSNLRRFCVGYHYIFSPLQSSRTDPFLPYTHSNTHKPNSPNPHPPLPNHRIPNLPTDPRLPARGVHRGRLSSIWCRTWHRQLVRPQHFGFLLGTNHCHRRSVVRRARRDEMGGQHLGEGETEVVERLGSDQ
jgi:hypothetical protein